MMMILRIAMRPLPAARIHEDSEIELLLPYVCMMKRVVQVKPPENTLRTTTILVALYQKHPKIILNG